MRNDYADVFQDTAAVERYESVEYAPDGYAAAINRRQRAYLRDLVGRSFETRRPVQHDFACGTGRALRALHGMVRGAHGYDSSPAMLAKADELGALAELHRVDATGPVPSPVATDSPAIVTVFRLLLNAGDEVRERAIAFAARVLPHQEAGLLVVENHGNRGSARHLRHRRHVGEPWFAELSHEEVTTLLARYGFSIVERRGFSVLTRGWYDRRWLRPVATVVDNVATRVPALSRYCVNVLYVARRTVPQVAPPRVQPPPHPDATTW
ncbi:MULTISPECIES: methyltransferase domain-containing protein [Polymorphospora]|uniref:Methyltransferase domain-containing protein n=1 Tax=Polymorphospora lycopeni TaxID=3140240 RepID=A0ABV5D281_9ACTN